MKGISWLTMTILFLIPISSAIASSEPWPPKVPFRYALGFSQFENLCARCDGQWAEASDEGPPLLHPYYKSSHHSDASFRKAILKGTRAHHWNFGDMPPVKNATPEDVKSIILYIRWLQRQKGIE